MGLLSGRATLNRIRHPCKELREADVQIISGATTAPLLALVLLATALPAQQIPAPQETSAAETAASATPAEAPVRAPGTSKVRIVRLSEVKGAVQLDRNTGVGFEQAMPNLPIVEGNHLQTGTGVAEVEFEDNSTLRLAPDTVIDFPELELLASGAKRSTIKVQKGMAYVSLVGTKGNEFTLLFGQEKLRLQPSSHIRLQMDATEAKLAVWDGS